MTADYMGNRHIRTVGRSAPTHVPESTPFASPGCDVRPMLYRCACSG
jgi:hypothetical protein